MKYTFNDHGICTDPDTYTRAGKGQTIEVRTAENKGRWGYGVSVTDNKGGGFSWGVNANNLQYNSQLEARAAALSDVLKRICLAEMSEGSQMELEL